MHLPRCRAAIVVLLAAGTIAGQNAGRLEITVGGLPPGATATVTVTGPNGYRQTLTGTGALTGLAPGAFSVAAATVNTAGALYLPAVFPRPDVTVAAGQTASAVIEYQSWTPAWESAGPAAIQGFGTLPAAGEVRPFAVNPSNPQEIYAASGGDGYFGPISQNGIWKTTDGGVTWNQKRSGLADPLVEALWLDRSNPRVLLAGTSKGIARSVDAGEHWTAAETCSSMTSAIGPVNTFLQTNGSLYAASGVGLLRSADGGSSWCMEQATPSPVWALSASGAALYLGLQNGRVMMRPSPGAAWSTSLPDSAAGRVVSIAAQPGNPSVAFVAAQQTPQSLFVTRDAGRTWTGVAAFSGPLVQAVAFQPGNPQVVFAGRDGALYRSTDAGATWQNVTMPAGWDIRSIEPDSAGISGRLLLGTDQGLFLSRDNGSTWSSLNGNMASAILYKIAVAGSTLLTAAQDFGALGSSDGGRTWRQIDNTIEGGEAFINPGNASYAYLYADRFRYSADGGKTFQPATVTRGALYSSNNKAIAVDPQTPSTVYVTAEDGVYQSLDWGRSFAPTNWPIPNYATAIAVNPSDPRTIFIGADVPEQGGSLYVTRNKGATWTKSVFNGAVPGYFVWSPTAIAIDPANPSRVVAGLHGWYLSNFGNGIYVSTDGGATFNAANTGIEAPDLVWNGMVHDVGFCPWYPGLLAAATATGLYVSADLGGHWNNLRGAAGPNFFTGLAWSNGYLYTSTFGQGVLKMPVGAPFEVRPASAAAPAAGSNGSLAVVAPAGSAWRARAAVPWITLSGASASVGSGSLAYSVAPNPSAVARAGAITVGAYYFYVYQDGVTPPDQPRIESVTNVGGAPAIAPGSWIVVKGANLSATTDDWSGAIVDGALPTTLRGVTMTVGGKPAYLSYVSPSQINAQAPDIPPAAAADVVVTSNGKASPPFPVRVNAVSPTLFLWGAYVAATRLDYSYADPGHPAQPGEVVILWGTGFQAGPAGVVPTDAYPITSAVTVRFGESAVRPIGVAAAAGSVSLTQIAVAVPSDLAPGDYSIALEVDGVRYPAGLLTIGSVKN